MSFLRTLTASMIILLLITTALSAQRPLPETVYDSVNNRSIFVFSDQLHSNLNNNEARFAATHYVGCQKMPRADIDLIRQFNENYIHLHYKLAITVDSTARFPTGVRYASSPTGFSRTPETSGQCTEAGVW